MSFYRYSDGEKPTFRLPLTLEATAGGTINWTFSLAGIADLDPFWDNVQSNGFDIRVTTADGRTLISPTEWDIQSFDKSARTGTIRAEGFSATAGMSLLWLYWGKPSADATSVWVGTPTPTSPKTVYLRREDPLKVDPALVITSASRTQSRATKPRTEFRKGAAEAVRIYFRLDGLRRSLFAESQGSDEWDTPSVGSHDVVDDQPADVPTMYTSTDSRFVADSEGQLYYSMIVKAGTSGSKYTARCLITTVDGSIIRYTCGVAVTDVVAS